MFRSHFPFFTANPDLVYLDSAATTHKPSCVIQAVSQAMSVDNVNVHRSSYTLAKRVTEHYEDARVKVAHFLHANDPQSIIWTKGATDSLNMLAQALSKRNHFSGTDILICISEHHANMLPWRDLASRCGLRVTYIDVDKNGAINYETLIDSITPNTAIVAVAHVSNALGCVFPVAEICQKANACGTLCIIDGTQAVAHLPVDVSALDCAAYVGSGHKMFAPMGIGFCYIRPDLMASLAPVQVGGEMVTRVTKDDVHFAAGALRFEAGTPNVAGALALATACEFIRTHWTFIQTQERALYQHALNGFVQLPDVRILGHQGGQHLPVFSFTVEGCNPYDILRWLDQEHIALRVGQHCAMPLFEALAIEGACRISLNAYNTKAELDYFFTALAKAIAECCNASVVGIEHNISPSTAHPLTELALPLAQQFQRGMGYDQVLRLLMLSSKACPKLNVANRTEANYISGCEVDVWLAMDELGQWSAHANSKVLRGLLALLLELANTQPQQRLSATSYFDHLAQLGVQQQLSQSRVEGLTHVIQRLSA
jgi:cysteine desulfurase/selenocysteine lyase